MRYQDCYYRSGWDPYPIAQRFLKRLSRFDGGRLRLRWSPEREKWILERKLVHGVEFVHRVPEYKKRFSPATGIVYEIPNDMYAAARDGYTIIDYINPVPPPGDWLITNLQFNDIRRWGGSKQFARTLEAHEARKEEKKAKEHKDRWEHLASESYDWLKRRYGEQVFVPRGLPTQSNSGPI